MQEVARNHEQEALLGLTGYAGLRIHEARACGPSWIDLQAMTIKVRGKGDKTRIVPLSPRAWGAISRAYIFAVSTKNARMIHYQDRSARKVITSLGERAGLSRRVASHDMRATFATIIHNNTLDQRVVQELLGHASGATTELYIGVAEEKMRKAVDF